MGLSLCVGPCDCEDLEIIPCIDKERASRQLPLQLKAPQIHKAPPLDYFENLPLA